MFFNNIKGFCEVQMSVEYQIVSPLPDCPFRFDVDHLDVNRQGSLELCILRELAVAAIILGNFRYVPAK